ncbi:MAG: oligosaccharyl transferase, archaeosortase A system-associated [Halolamina sp.]|uniref:oligosaccharyl transferase, archaeosortase A system-associated n=1 Tax=Halolamina sp. TaxID=1940283 RepID=UPI002FC3CD25
MSSRTESDDFGQSLLDIAEDWFHVPALLLAIVVMFWVRMQNYSRFIRDGQVFFSGNDAWYHLRETNYVVRNFPFTMPFDPWTGFPTGTFVGQFGTLYDQLIALAALLIGLGSPNDALIAKTLLVAPAVFGALTVVPVYLIGKRFSNRVGGLFGVLIIALLPGTFLQRTLVGAADHNAAEPLFMGLAVFGLLAAFAAATRSMPVWEVVQEELIENRKPDTLTQPLAWAVLAGVLTGLFFWVWPPAVFLIGVVGLFAAVNITSDVVNNDTPEPIAFAVAVSMGTAAVMSLLMIDMFSFSTTDHSLIQPVTTLAVAGAAVFLCWLARYWEREELSTSLYPAAVLGLAVVGVLFVSVALESLYSQVARNLLRIVGFSAGAATRTIGEAQPFLGGRLVNQVGAAGRITLEYGLTFFSALLAIVILHGRPLVRKGTQRAYYYLGGSLLVVALIFATPVLDAVGGVIGVDPQVLGLLIVAGLIAGATLIAEYDPEELFLVVWAGFMTSMAFTQVRFNYYLAVVVAVANAFLFVRVLDWVDLTGSIRNITEDIQGYQVLAVAAALLLIVAPVLAVPITLGGSASAQGGGVQTSTAKQAGNSTAPGAILGWEGTFDWIQDNTPEEGTLGGAENADRMEYYGTYERTDDFEYPDGAYGVMSWWDYGHWITTQSQRIPNANPFQQGATNAANFLLAPSESQANDVLSENAGENEETRYVMVDWQMASTRSKFGAPTVFYDARENVSSQDFYQNVWIPRGQGAVPAAQIYSQRYYDSMMVRLYRYHGSAQDAAPLVTDWETRTYETAAGEDISLKLPPQDNTSMVKRFDNMSAARAYVEEDGSARIGGVGPFPSEDVPALEHYRLVKASETQSRQVFANEQRQAQLAGNPLYQLLFSRTTPSWVKTFEKVPGATVEGSNAPPNTRVTATVEMNMPGPNSTFSYQQHAMSNEDGEFEMVLPYSTIGYDNFGPENGYTNVSVRANTSYTITTPPTINESGYRSNYGQQFDVSEAKVLGVNESAKQVTLEKRTVPPEGTTNTTNNTSSLAAPQQSLDPTSETEEIDTLSSSVTVDGSTNVPVRDAEGVVVPALD